MSTPHADTALTERSQTPGWFALTAEQILAAVAARPETWKPVGTWQQRAVSHYEVSDKGGLRSLGRVIKGRALQGKVLSTGAGKNGYPKAKITADDGTVFTVSIHVLVVTTFDPRCARGIPAGMETRHGPAGPLCAAWPENLTIGTWHENELDKAEPYAPPPPSFPCLNAPRCEGLASHEGRRCAECSEESGRQVAIMLRLGMRLADAAARFDFSEKWAYERARSCGGYTGSMADARRQRPSWSQRVRIRGAERAGLIPRPARGDRT